MTQIYTTKSFRKGWTGFSSEELTERLDKVLMNEEAAEAVYKKVIVDKHPERYKVVTPLASEQEVAEKILTADANDVRHQPVDQKAFGLRQDLMNDLKKQHGTQTDWNKKTEDELKAMGIDPASYNYTPVPHWAEDFMEDDDEE